MRMRLATVPGKIHESRVPGATLCLVARYGIAVLGSQRMKVRVRLQKLTELRVLLAVTRPLPPANHGIHVQCLHLLRP